MAKSKSYKKRTAKRTMRKMKKGGSAWQYTQSVYGSADQQHPVGLLPNGGTSNMIAINPAQSGGSGGIIPLAHSDFVTGGSNLPALNPSSFANDTLSGQGMHAMAVSTNDGAMASHPTNMFGGRRRRKGGNVLSEIALPATLLIANEIGKNATMNRGVYLGKTNKKNYRKKNYRTFRKR